MYPFWMHDADFLEPLRVREGEGEEEGGGGGGPYIDIYYVCSHFRRFCAKANFRKNKSNLPFSGENMAELRVTALVPPRVIIEQPHCITPPRKLQYSSALYSFCKPPACLTMASLVVQSTRKLEIRQAISLGTLPRTHL